MARVHVTVFSARGRMTRCEINEMHDGAAELRITSGNNTVILQMDEVQLAALGQDINRHLDRQLATRMRVVKRQTAPVGGAVR